ncbi:TonB-dependent receptor [Porphyrobacter sp. SLTP]|jgi:outer membrane receptor protein involved in Fe transport|uniref:TonB-dependent receptor n=1 Tax=Porphyrobacter sp. SLTP TaxID=2683266 RepID=UPI001411BA3A|nr:TonB-dependent receptor [Porphyrobacter sp. SLTP]NBB26505.1 TonB-dependent receptor [Porphyrobacter sp. SLTP]
MRSTITGIAGAYRFTLLAGAATFALAMPGTAFAQEQDPEVEAPESSNVIIVTASKREQTLQETPISVSVTSGETLENAQIRDVLDLQTVTPSLRVSQLQSASATTFIIRGFGNGDNNFGIEPSVGVFIDGVFRSRSAAALSDLNMVSRIEVLNGPQSTLFGKNASAGVISVVTKEPEYEFGGVVEASYGNYNAIVVRGEVTGPISENIAFSLDGSYNKRDGYARIVNLDEDLSDRNRWSARGQLLIEPSTDFKVRIIGDYGRIDEVCCQVSTLVAGPSAPAVFAVGGALDTNFFSYNTFLSQVPRNTVDNYGGSIQADWNVGNLTVTSITAYRELKNFLDQDVDFTSADVVSELRDQKVDTFTQELRITSDFDGPINFLLGGFYFDESISQDSRLTTGADTRAFFSLLAGNPLVFNGVEAGLGLPQNSIFSPGPLTAEQFSMDNKSWSVFGTVDFEPVDGLVFTAGFNYTDDKKDFALAQQSFDELSNINLVDAFITGATLQNPNLPDVFTRAQFQALPGVVQQQLLAAATNPATNPLLGLTPFQFQPPFLNLPNAVEPGRTQDDQFTYLLRAAYEVSNEVNIYASYATGFKASSINLSRDSRPAFGDYIPGPGRSSFAAPASPITTGGLGVANLTTGSRFAGPEKAEVYEIGMKAQWDGFGFNLALFDQTIKGFQSFLFTGTGFQLNNAGEQSVRGFEVDATINPTDGLVFTFAATHLDPKFNSFDESPVGNLTGARPGGIPAWSLATSATYTLEFGDSGNALVTRVDYAHESNVAINNGLPTFNAALGNTRIFQRETNLVNASMTFKLENGLEIGAWARNLLDDQYIITVFDGVAQAGTVSGYPSQPRTYGGLVRFRF